MRGHFLAVSAAAFFFIFLLAGPSRAQEGVDRVPASLSAIQDDLLRDSLAQYSPAYDSLPRGDQLIAYANVYRALYGQELAAPRPSTPVFTTPRPYDPKIDVPVEKYAENPERYNRYWDANKHGGTGRYEPWRDPMWTPREEHGVFW